MTISDHLEMIGVELRATWTQTRKANGDIVQSRAENTIRPWKSGKFMPLSMRSWSVNQYCLSKVFFRTHSVDLRVMDVTKITSTVKSWLYADQLLKPEELVLYRPAVHGGLGMLHVKFKAMAGLIKTFLETAGNEKFRTSLYHNMLYRYHILGDTSLPNPGLPPFYSRYFFFAIQKVVNENSKNIFQMTEQEWYYFLLEEHCTMEMGESRMEYIKCRVERRSPDTDWENSWRLARLPGLGPDNISFLFRMLHQTLPTQERVARTKPNQSSICKMQECNANQEEDLDHALIQCEANACMGTQLLSCLNTIEPGLNAEALLRLELPVDEELELPVVWLLSTVFRIIWNLRQSSTRIRQYLVRSQLEAEINLLRETRYQNAVPIIEELAANLFR